VKLAILGAGGVRTPLLCQAILKRQDRLGLSELSLMDIDGERLEIVGSLTDSFINNQTKRFHVTRTTDARQALSGADFVITTFRVGGIESRVIDERVALNYGILGQETTGPGGFAMGMRSIPVILDYVRLMEELCPAAWLINFANPAGMLTEAVLRNTAWRRVIGICDAPSSMWNVISAVLQANRDEIFVEYFGLNHLGWIKKVMLRGQDMLPGLLDMVNRMGSLPGLPFDPQVVNSLGMIPNEYLYYYYYAQQAVDHILSAKECRGEQIARENLALFTELKAKYNKQDFNGMQAAYQAYLDQRSSTYMLSETGRSHDFSSLSPYFLPSLALDEGYAGVALDLIVALLGIKSRTLILNLPGQGCVRDMDDLDVLELPAAVSQDHIQPFPIEGIPSHCLGLILQVKHYERLTIEAATQSSYSKARWALTTHPLVQDYDLAGRILDEYISRHTGYFPNLH
jgi:6-phospho-beta-glucosidase